ncbi:MAG: GNAT family N-acetyltransferase [Halanaerobium sp.]|nr:GNAT family N-acetyltransferase [Halanaerobium sp.]
MQEQLVVRYFYSPICPESFATLERLKSLFQNYREVYFEYFNFAAEKPSSKISWFPAEEAVLATCKGKGRQPLFFGKLFIEGTVIQGFPPSPLSLQKVFAKNNLKWVPELYPFEYSSPPQIDQDIIFTDFQLFSYGESLTRDSCQLCTRYHPYLSETSYDPGTWQRHEEKKLQFLQKAHAENRLLGEIAYNQRQPVGFIEAFNLNLARELGFPVSAAAKSGLMITCLSIRPEFSGQGLARKLLGKLEEDAHNRGYHSLEVISFPDSHNWQPSSLYQKMGYTTYECIEELKIMKKCLI